MATLRVERYCIYITLCLFVTIAHSQDLASYFKDCHIGDEKFDSCLQTALNDIRPLFKPGLPQYGVDPFDPFFVKRLRYKRGGSNANINLILNNISESGWTASKITTLRTDFKNNKMVYSQIFPNKFLKGEFEIVGNILGRKLNNAGTWNLTLNDYTQTTTVTRKPRRAENGTLMYDTPIKANIRYETVKSLEMHFGDPSGQSGAAGMIDQLVNNSWPIGILFLRGIIDELVSTAFSEIFTKAFQNFPFNEVIN